MKTSLPMPRCYMVIIDVNDNSRNMELYTWWLTLEITSKIHI